MTEGGNFSRTLEGGSEALFDRECTECRSRGTKQEAEEFCQDCNQFLCKICARYHIRYMKTHTMVYVAAMTQPNKILPKSSPVQVVAKCQFHPDQDIKMYCGTHDMVYCYGCVAKDHRACSDVKDIEDVAHKSSLSTLQTLVADITRVSAELHSTKLEKSNDLKLLKKKRASLLEEIKAVRKKFNKQLDALEREIIAELDEEQKKLEKEIGDGITAVDYLINATDNTKPDMRSHLDEKQIFITEKLGQVILAEANTFLKRANELKTPSLKFEPNDVLCNTIDKSDRMGNIIRSDAGPKRIQRKKYTVASVDKINVRVKSDKKESLIRQMCQLANGTILLIDANNNKLKRLDGQLNVKDFLEFKASPRGLCALSCAEVAVRLDDNTSHFIHVGKSLSDQRKVSINHPKPDFYGLACCRDQFWIPGDKAVYVYSLSGTLVKKLDTNSKGRNIFHDNNAQHIAVSNDGTTVYVTTYEDRVVVFNNDVDVINELRDQRLEDAYSICVTEDDIILVGGGLSKNVVMLGRDGNCLGELVSSKDMLSYPHSLCYDRVKCRLIVGYDLDTAQLYKLS